MLSMTIRSVVILLVLLLILAIFVFAIILSDLKVELYQFYFFSDKSVLFPLIFLFSFALIFACVFIIIFSYSCFGYFLLYLVSFFLSGNLTLLIEGFS